MRRGWAEAKEKDEVLATERREGESDSVQLSVPSWMEGLSASSTHATLPPLLCLRLGTWKSSEVDESNRRSKARHKCGIVKS